MVCRKYIKSVQVYVIEIRKYLMVITTAPSPTGIWTPLGTVHGRNSPIGTRLTHLRKELRIASLWDWNSSWACTLLSWNSNSLLSRGFWGFRSLLLKQESDEKFDSVMKTKHPEWPQITVISFSVVFIQQRGMVSIQYGLRFSLHSAMRSGVPTVFKELFQVLRI